MRVVKREAGEKGGKSSEHKVLYIEIIEADGM